MHRYIVAVLALGVTLVTNSAIADSAQSGRFGHDAKPKSCANSNRQQGCIAATNSTAGNAVLGRNSSTGTGVYGWSTSSAGGIGVQGESDGSGFGVLGSSNTGEGLYGVSVGATAIYGITFGAASGVEGDFDGPNSAPGAAISGISNTNGVPAYYGQVSTSVGNYLAEYFGGGGYQILDDSGNIFASGEIYTSGSCQSGCSRTRGVREYAARSTEATLDDEGEATLRYGTVHVALDPAFANAIDDQRPYIVTVTPEGDCNGLYVANRTATGFDVRELRGGRSTTGFAYRIVAKRFGAPRQRLGVVIAPVAHAKKRPPVPPTFHF
jgi:hypothetical protein